MSISEAPYGRVNSLSDNNPDPDPYPTHIQHTSMSQPDQDSRLRKNLNPMKLKRLKWKKSAMKWKRLKLKKFI